MHPGRSLFRRCKIAGLLLSLGLAACDDAVDIQFPTPVDDHWWGGFDAQGLNDYVYVLGEYDGDLVAGGLFTTAGGVAARSVARWDGSAWSSFGDGMELEGCPGTVCLPWVAALATFEGDLVAGGRFTAAGGVPAANVARWNGAAWSPIGQGFDDNVFALGVYQGELVAGGLFTRSGADTTVSHLARWDGTAWRALGGGTNDAVRTLLVRDSSLVVGGDFTIAGQDSAGYVGIWDGRTWTLPAPFLNRRVRAAALYQDVLVLGGDFYRTQDDTMWFWNIAFWDGRHWAGRDGPGGDTYGLCVYRDRLVAGGAFTDNGNMRLARYEDNRWLGFGRGLDRYVSSVLVHDGRLYVGGGFRFAGDKPSRYIACWDD